jgi:hypothetical protein
VDDFTPPGFKKSRKKVRKKRNTYRPSTPRRRTKKRKKKSRSSSTSPNYLVYLSPFGAGQFWNGDYLMGALFAGGQAYGLFTWYQSTQNADTAFAQASAYLAENNNEDDPVAQEFKANSEAYIAAQREQANLGLLVFAGAYGLGVVECIWNAPKPTSKKRRRRRAALLPQSEFDATMTAGMNAAGSEEMITPTPGATTRLRLGLLPYENDENGATEIGMGLGVKVDF